MWLLVKSNRALVNTDQVLINTDQVLVNSDLALVNTKSVLVNCDRVLVNTEWVLVNTEQVLLKSEGILVKVQVLVNSPAADLTLYNCIFWFCCQEDRCRKSHSHLFSEEGNNKIHVPVTKCCRNFHFISFCCFFVNKVTQAMLWHHQYKTSQELRTLSRSLSHCKSLTLNVMVQVSQFVSYSQLSH